MFSAWDSQESYSFGSLSYISKSLLIAILMVDLNVIRAVEDYSVVTTKQKAS